jgi:hypothetical protein
MAIWWHRKHSSQNVKYLRNSSGRASDMLHDFGGVLGTALWSIIQLYMETLDDDDPD